MIEIMFDAFWAAYPRKVAKLAALKKWKQIKHMAVTFPKIIKAVEAQKKEWTDMKFIPHPATWLNQGRWDDETTTHKGAAKVNQCARCGSTNVSTMRDKKWWCNSACYYGTDVAGVHSIGANALPATKPITGDKK